MRKSETSSLFASGRGELPEGWVSGEEVANNKIRMRSKCLNLNRLTAKNQPALNNSFELASELWRSKSKYCFCLGGWGSAAFPPSASDTADSEKEKFDAIFY